MFMHLFQKRKKENAEQLFNRNILIAYAIIGCLVGFILIIISSYAGEFQSVLSNLGSLLVSISSGSFLLELFGYVNYTRKRMCEILCEDDVLEVLTTQRKKELKTALLNNLYMPNKDLGDNNIVQVIDNEMDNILKDYYYKEYIMYVDISIKEIKGVKYISKTIKKTYEAETINNQNCIIDKLLDIQTLPIHSSQAVKLEYLRINSEEILDAKNYVKTKKIKDNTAVGTHYNDMYYIDTEDFKNKLKFNKTISIDIKYETLTPITDKIFSHQIKKPCKHYCIHFNYDPNVELDIVGFGFMTDGNKNKKRIVKTTHGLMLRFLTWILPGDGVMAVISTKNDIKTTHKRYSRIERRQW